MRSLIRGKAKNTEALTPRERQAQGLMRRRRAQKRRRIALAGGLGAMALGLLGAAAGGRLDAAAAWFDRASQTAAVEAGLTVETIKVTGREWTDKAALRQALEVARGQSLLHLDLAKMRRRVEALGWVQTADLYRTLPNQLNLDVAERQPFAVWQYEGALRLIDRTGTVIVPAAPEEFRDLPLVVGKGAADDAAALEAMLAAEPALAARVTAAVRVGDRRWNIRFENGVEARLPGRDAPAAWRRLARLEREHGLLKRNILHVDLRLEDRLVVRRRAVRFRLDGPEI